MYIDGMANELTTPSEPFLKVPCRKYLKTMINSYDVLRSEVYNHKSFIIYWSECVETKPSALNAMQYAFKYYDKSENESIDDVSAKIADDYLEALVRYYNSERPDKAFGKHVAQFIRGFKSNTRTEIKAEDFEWYPPKWRKEFPEELRLNTKEIEYIAKEFDFAWKCARLWQLLEDRKQECYILNFLGINKIKFTEISNIPSEISSRLNETAVEDPEYLKKIVVYFTPEQMTKRDMAVLLKKACRASIQKQLKDGIKEISPSNARIKPLDSLWLLARFYGIHQYRLDFIARKMPYRAMKQFNGIDGNTPFLDWERDLEEMINNGGDIRVGNRTYPLIEVLMTMYNYKVLLDFFEHKSNEIIPGKEKNPYKPILQAISEQNFETSAISYLDLSNEKWRKFIKEHIRVFKAMIFCSFVLDAKYEDLKKEYCSRLVNSAVLDNFLVGAMVADGLQNPKNLYFITVDDFDEWDMVVAIIIWHSLYSKQISASS